MQYENRKLQCVKNYQQKSMSKYRLKDVRIINRSSVHLIGLPKQICHANILKQQQFFGQYGEIVRILIRRGTNQFGEQCDQIFIKFSNTIDASIAALCLNGFLINKTQVKASHGLNRYCQYFLRGKECRIQNCGYYHQQAQDDEWCFKEQAKYQKQIKQQKNSDLFKYLIKQNFDFIGFFTKFDADQFNVLPGKSFMLKKFFKYLIKHSLCSFFLDKTLGKKQLSILVQNYLQQYKNNYQKHKNKQAVFDSSHYQNNFNDCKLKKDDFQYFYHLINLQVSKKKQMEKEQFFLNYQKFLQNQTQKKEQKKESKQKQIHGLDQFSSFSDSLSNYKNKLIIDQFETLDQIDNDTINQKLIQIHFGNANTDIQNRLYQSSFQLDFEQNQEDLQKVNLQLQQIAKSIKQKQTRFVKQTLKHVKTNNIQLD